MTEDLQLDLPLTSAQATLGHECAVTLTRRVKLGERLVLAEEVARVKVPAGLAPLTVLRLKGLGHISPEGSGGDALLRLVIDAAGAQELRLSPADARRGTRRMTATALGRRVDVEVPAGLETGMALQASGVHFRIVVDPSLADDAPRGPARRSPDLWLRLAGLAFALYGFIGAFALPFSDLGKPVVFIDGRFFVLGFLGLTIAAFGVGGGALRGRRKAVALTLAMAGLIAISASTWGLIRLLEHFGYFLRFS